MVAGKIDCYIESRQDRPALSGKHVGIQRYARSPTRLNSIFAVRWAAADSRYSSVGSDPRASRRLVELRPRAVDWMI